ERLIFEGLNLDILRKKDLLNVKIVHLFCVDSSQMEDNQRDDIIKAIHAEYVDVDGIIILHGTDSGADTVKILHLALPDYDPRTIWKDGSRVFNWGKPVLVLSSQVPAVDAINCNITYRIDSDGPMNLSLALMLISDGNVGESGIITNNGTALRGTACEKGAEVDIPPYRTDPGVPPMAKYTALGLRYLPQGCLQRTGEGQTFIPFVIHGSSRYEDKVITVFESSHLSLLKTYLESEGLEKKRIREKLPEVVVYVSKGAGNVKSQDYKILKAVEKEGVVSFRVPLPGGRIPAQQIYDVPGHEITALNMQPQSAKYKAMMSLYMAENVFKIKKNEKAKFLKMMMTGTWGNEFLPRR
ncbi:asparaginase, partial [Candidatus Woesearchaeota archaeon]|nr:asparaginase [Candidatus Woesearchaeota archaeon]